MIYFDFDGTIVDVWQRYYHAFLLASGIQDLSFSAYCTLKKQFPRDGDLALSIGKNLVDGYWIKKKELLEAPELLRLDTLLLSAEDLLCFFKRYPCRILTYRRNAHQFHAQLTDLGLGALTEQSIVLNPDLPLTKCQLIHEASDRPCWLIGDAQSEADVSIRSDCKVALVRTGLRVPETLDKAGNCLIIEDISSFINQYGTFI